MTYKIASFYHEHMREWQQLYTANQRRASRGNRDNAKKVHVLEIECMAQCPVVDQCEVNSSRSSTK